MKKIISLLFAGLVGFSTFAAPTVTDVVAKQRYPWNGLVDITCKVSGIEDSKSYDFCVDAVIPDSGTTNGLSQFWVVQNGTKQNSFKVTANGDYHLIWDAKAELGSTRCTNMVVSVNLLRWRDKVQLWEGGPYWATTNIGAEEPWEYGYYFWWGDTVGYKRENDKWVGSDGSNSNFSFISGNVPTYVKSNSTLLSEGWITDDGVLAPEHDAAKKHWGGDWRMPTMQEFDDLNSKCVWTWTTMNGVNGYIVRGRGSYASNRIFLPCAGIGDGTSLRIAGWYGSFWSSVPNSEISHWACCHGFDSGLQRATNSGDRYDGKSVRPLQGFIK
jgi:hypothetical protein